MWRARRPELYIAGVRIAGEMAHAEAQSAWELLAMVAAVRDRWMPIFQNRGADAEGLEKEATR